MYFKNIRFIRKEKVLSSTTKRIYPSLPFLYISGMQQLPFVYSNQPRWILARHLSFWLLWLLFQLSIYSVSPSSILQGQSLWMRLRIISPDTFLYLVPSLFFAYTLMYFVIPRMILPERYVMAILSIILLIGMTAALDALLSLTILDYVRHLIADPVSAVVARQAHPPFYIQFGLAMIAGMRGSITVGGVAAAIKLMKCFYEKQQAALVLEKEKVNAELPLTFFSWISRCRRSAEQI